MKNKIVEEVLKKLILEYGIELCTNRQRVEGLLRDYCPKHKMEINILIQALREGIPEELLNTNHLQIDYFLFNRLFLNLKNNTGMNNECAHWAVKTWAHSLSKKIRVMKSVIHPCQSGKTKVNKVSSITTSTNNQNLKPSSEKKLNLYYVLIASISLIICFELNNFIKIYFGLFPKWKIFLLFIFLPLLFLFTRLSGTPLTIGLVDALRNTNWNYFLTTFKMWFYLIGIFSVFIVGMFLLGNLFVISVTSNAVCLFCVVASLLHCWLSMKK